MTMADTLHHRTPPNRRLALIGLTGLLFFLLLWLGRAYL